MTRPYYEDKWVTIYHGDCQDFLPRFQAGAVVTDPPYGLGFRGETWDSRVPVWLPLARTAAPVVMFTTAPTTLWDYPRPDWVMCWYRPASNSRSVWGGFNHWTPVLVYGQPRISPDVLSLHAIKHSAPAWLLHPSPKPVALGHWLIGATEGTILDPFCGSGAFLRAAKDLGRKAIGIEIEERYCEIAAKRMGQEVLAI